MKTCWHCGGHGAVLVSHGRLRGKETVIGYSYQCFRCGYTTPEQPTVHELDASDTEHMAEAYGLPPDMSDVKGCALAVVGRLVVVGAVCLVLWLIYGG